MCVQQGGQRYQEASFIFQELVTKFGPSVMLLNGLAVAHLHQGKFEEAEKALMEAVKTVRRREDHQHPPNPACWGPPQPGRCRRCVLLLLL